MFKTVLPSIEANDAWIADRNFCTIEFTCGIASRGAYFVIREHKKYPWQSLGKEKYIGKIETGTVYEQPILVRDDSGRDYTFRRLRISLKKKTRDGDTEIFIISNLSKRSADAKKLSGLYRSRWTIRDRFSTADGTFEFGNKYPGLSPRGALWFLYRPCGVHHLVYHKIRACQCPWRRCYRETGFRLLCVR